MRELFRRRSFWLAAVVLLVFGARALIGLVGGSAYARGAVLAAEGYYDEAIPLLERGAVGENRFEALWLLAEVRLGLWLQMEAAAEPGDGRGVVLRESASDYLRAARVSPAAGWSWAGLGNLFNRVEQSERENRVYDLSALSGSPWSRVGEPGRLAVGMLRTAISLEPRSHVYHDWLVLSFLRMGLEQESAEEIRRSAAVHPSFDAHAVLGLASLPDSLLREFAESSRVAEDEATLLSGERHLFSLGKLYHRLGRTAEAEDLLNRAANQPARSLHRAEIQYHLAHVLFDQGRHEEAGAALDLAEEEPVFEAGSCRLRARIALEQGNPEEALRQIQRARKMEPGNLGLCLTYARIAREQGRIDEALEALRWAIIIHPRNQIPRVELARMLLHSGDLVGAQSVLQRAFLVLDETAELTRLETELVKRGGSPVDRRN